MPPGDTSSEGGVQPLAAVTPYSVAQTGVTVTTNPVVQPGDIQAGYQLSNTTGM